MNVVKYDYAGSAQRNGGLINSIMVDNNEEKQVVVTHFPVSSNDIRLFVDVSNLDQLSPEMYASLNGDIIEKLIDAFVNIHIKGVILNLRERVEQDVNTKLTPREAFAVATAAGVEIELVLDSSNITSGHLAFKPKNDVRCYLKGEEVVVLTEKMMSTQGGQKDE